MLRLRRAIVLALPLAACLTAARPGSAQDEDPGAQPKSRAELLRRQREAKARSLVPQKVSKPERQVREFEESGALVRILTYGFKGIHPVLGGMPAGASLVGGLGYTRRDALDRVRFNVEALVSAKLWTQASVELEVPAPSRSRIRGYVAGRFYDYKTLGFFGLGGDSREGDRTTYRLQATTAVGGARFRSRYIEVGGEAGPIDIEVKPGKSGTSIEDAFTPAEAPGLGEEPSFLVYHGYARLDLRDHHLPAAGVVLLGSYERYVDHGGDRDGDTFDFWRWVGEAQAHLPLGPKSRMLAVRLRAAAAIADEGATVPFYFMETLGGARTLRGFNDYRFRDTRSLLASGEYRWEVMTFCDFAVFADAGKVFHDRHDLDFSDLKVGYGIGARVRWPLGAFRIDLARSKEGMRLTLGGGPRF